MSKCLFCNVNQLTPAKWRRSGRCQNDVEVKYTHSRRDHLAKAHPSGSLISYLGNHNEKTFLLGRMSENVQEMTTRCLCTYNVDNAGLQFGAHEMIQQSEILGSHDHRD